MTTHQEDELTLFVLKAVQALLRQECTAAHVQETIRIALRTAARAAKQ